jgi:hypothetical protein
MQWLQSLAAEFPVTVSNGDVWLSILEGLVFGVVCLAFGVWIARRIGLLEPDAPTGETLGVGLACGLIVIATWWAAVRSGGRSAFTPVAIGFVVAVAVSMARLQRRDVDIDPARSRDGSAGAHTGRRWSRYRATVLKGLACSAFVVAIALLYGSTMAPSPRDGAQPVEFNDEAYYSVLGQDLATTGTETVYSTSGFPPLEGLPVQSWYHWGELWLASAVITVFGAAPMAARYFVVLPVILLAAAALTGTVVRRLTGTTSWRAYLLGFAACLFLAPIPVIPGPYFSSWAVGLVFGITQYGLAAVAVLLALYMVTVLAGRGTGWPLAIFSGSAIAFILPAHLVVGLLALAGLGSVWGFRVVSSLWSTRRLPDVSPVWRRTLAATGAAVSATVTWGVLTGHGLAASAASPSVAPFNASWSDSVGITLLGAGTFFAIPVAWALVRRKASIQADLYLGTAVLLIAGAVAWGARLGDYNMFYVFFGGIAVFATPAAAVAIWTVRDRLHSTGRQRLLLCLLLICVVQLDLGGATAIIRLGAFGPRFGYQPIATDLLAAIDQLPGNAELAYACQPFEEVSFSDPMLESIAAHTGRPVIPMCFEADTLGTLIGVKSSLLVPDAFFRWAPQKTLYPDAAARPSSAAVEKFLKANGIDYIYADGAHPNSLVADAIPVATSKDGQVLLIP